MNPPPVDAEIQASDVVWDLEPLVHGQGDAGLDRLLDEAERRSKAIAVHRGKIATMDAAALSALMREVEAISDLLGRAGSYAELRFAADTMDEANGARVAHTEERLTAISNELIFIRLEWATAPDDRTAELLRSPALDFCRHHLAVARRYRPHLLTEPEERILAAKNVTGRNAWGRLFQRSL